MKAKLCGWAGCQHIVTDDPYYCPTHRAMADKRRKESAYATATRYADYNCREWRLLRYQVLKENPRCECCGIHKDNAVLEVHHIVPVRDDPSRFLDRTNLKVLCKSCHAVETQREIFKRHKER